jgi:NitT/TauT family transport system permease protein
MKDFITKNKKKSVNKVFIFIIWMAVWQGMYFLVGRDIYVPSPINVFNRLKELIFLSFFWKSISHSIFRVIAGLFLSFLLGLIIGVASSINNYIYDLINPLIGVIKSTPVMSFIIIALIWFSSDFAPIFICFLMCFPIIWTNVVAGIRNVDTQLLEMAEVYNVKKYNIIKHIYLPSIAPYFYAASITTLGLGWKVTVAAEVLSYPRNAIGSHLYSAKVYLDSSDLFAWTVVVILLSLLFENLFAHFIRKMIIEKRAVADIK